MSYEYLEEYLCTDEETSEFGECVWSLAVKIMNEALDGVWRELYTLHAHAVWSPAEPSCRPFPR
jgi:hypothetical protein